MIKKQTKEKPINWTQNVAGDDINNVTATKLKWSVIMKITPSLFPKGVSIQMHGSANHPNGKCQCADFKLSLVQH